MTVLLISIHVLVCFAIIVIVLLQAGKGAEVGASFGSSSSQTVFGASGSQSFMSKLTTGAATIFMLTSLSLAYFYGDSTSSSVMPDQSAPPASQQAPAPDSAPPTSSEQTPALPNEPAGTEE